MQDDPIYIADEIICLTHDGVELGYFQVIQNFKLLTIVEHAQEEIFGQYSQELIPVDQFVAWAVGSNYLKRCTEPSSVPWEIASEYLEEKRETYS